ncbi:MAG: hypothetical protein COC22_00250 [Flavobacteriaceae bacterium]|nr:MAG: hypothetical protein COC22_00250 [Flavobacteriaceae bacterium]
MEYGLALKQALAKQQGVDLDMVKMSGNAAPLTSYLEVGYAAILPNDGQDRRIVYGQLLKEQFNIISKALNADNATQIAADTLTPMLEQEGFAIDWDYVIDRQNGDIQQAFDDVLILKPTPTHELTSKTRKLAENYILAERRWNNANYNRTDISQSEFSDANHDWHQKEQELRRGFKKEGLILPQVIIESSLHSYYPELSQSALKEQLEQATANNYNWEDTQKIILWEQQQKSLIDKDMGSYDVQGTFVPNSEKITLENISSLSKDELVYLEASARDQSDMLYSMEIDSGKSQEQAKEAVENSPEGKLLNVITTSLESNPPTDKQLEYAQKLSKRQNVEIPKEAMQNKDAMRQYLHDHTPRPSNKQISYAASIAKRINIGLPDKIRTDTKVMKRFLNEHSPGRRVQAMSSGRQKEQGHER